MVEVGTEGEITSWSWVSNVRDGQPLQTRPHALAMIKLDGADTSMLHVVDAAGSRRRDHRCPCPHPLGRRARGPDHRHRLLRAGQPEARHLAEATDGARRQRPRRLDPARRPVVTAPADGRARLRSDAEPVQRLRLPASLRYRYTPGQGHDPLPARARRRRSSWASGARSPATSTSRRAACHPTVGLPTTEQVEVGPKGTIARFCVVHIGFGVQRAADPVRLRADPARRCRRVALRHPARGAHRGRADRHAGRAGLGPRRRARPTAPRTSRTGGRSTSPTSPAESLKGHM